ncbi:hypothetical protein BC834DRAFT_924863 [Gloeopeniophorella convolvens]|nr:hypothetical protein BC834DRAFT_924863 [Gloeopeniophorella convolvens]
MSRSATASTSKNPPQLPTKSAWARGPPQQNSATTTPSRSQSPAPTTPISAANPAAFHATHSRRSSTLGQGVSIKDGVSIPRNTVNAVKQGQSVTFGSIDDAQAPISSSPASAPVVKPAEGVKSFGSVAVQNGVSDAAAAKTAVTTKPPSLSSAPSTSSSQPSPAPPATPSPAPPPKIDRKAVMKLFQGPSIQSQPTPPPETASPAMRSASLPQPGQGQPYQNFNAGGMRQGQNGTPSGPPRSPVIPRPMLNGQSGGVGVGVSGRPQAGSGGPSSGPVPAAMPSPRMTPHPHPAAPPSGMPPQPPPMWGAYYFVPPEQYYAQQWPGHMIPAQHQHQQHQHQQPPPPPHHPSGPSPPSAGMPMSPRAQPPPLQQVPGTPTQSHALPAPLHLPHPSAHTPLSVSSPPPTPSTATNRATSLSANAGAFVPGKKISIKDPFSGQQLNIDTLKRKPPSVSPVPASPVAVAKDPKRTSVRIEAPEQKAKRLAEEKAKEEEERLIAVRADEARRAQEDAERKAREEAARREHEAHEAAERERKEAEERAAREAREAEQRRAAAAEEAERVRVEAERVAREKAEREAQEELERVRKAKEEEDARVAAAEQQRKAEDEARAAAAAAAIAAAEAEAEAEAKAAAAAAAAATATPVVPEEGEIADESASASAREDAPSPAPASAKPVDKEPLRIETALPSPDHPRKRPGPLNLQTTITANIPAGLPSALATARHIEDIKSMQYPEGIRSPKIELNVNSQKGKFRYDREFLLQFMGICKDKPDNLPPLDVIGLEPSGDASHPHPISRGGSGRNRASNSMSMPGSARAASIGLGLFPGAMGQFATSAKMTSEERFLAANGANRSASLSGGPLGGRAPPMVRTSSQGGTGSRDRTRSRRGGRNRIARAPWADPGLLPPPLLLRPTWAWACRSSPSRRSRRRRTAGWPGARGARRQRRHGLARGCRAQVKGLLNKLTMERFDSISDQIIAWANKSEREKDGRTLIQVIKLVFEKATDEATFSEMYARLCRKMMEQISAGVQDDGIKNLEGRPFAGGQLFRKYLLNRCQEDFERGWVAKEAAAAAAAGKAAEDQAAKAKAEADKAQTDESELYSDEYYAAAKAKRRGLGLIRFIGELFKLQMLTERIMHECIKKLLGNVENPEEEEIESLCKLLSTVGSLLDTPKARAHMDVYFTRMRELRKNDKVNARMIFMLQDVIELRERKWIPRNAVAAPATIAQIHEAAAKEKLAQEKESYLRQNSMSRGGSRRGGGRDGGETAHPDGWSVAGTGAPRAQPKAGDLSHFGKITKTNGPPVLGPGSVFAGKNKGNVPPVSRTASSSNMFSMLQSTDAAVAEPLASKSSRPPSRKPSVDLGAAGIPEPSAQRRRLQLLPRSKPVGEESKPSTPAASEAGSDDEDDDAAERDGPEPAALSDAEAKAKIGEDVKELFGVRSVDEAESYFSSLPAAHRAALVDALVLAAIEMKEPDVQLVAGVLARAREKGLCAPAALEEGFAPLAEMLDDLAVDIPKAWAYFVSLMRGAGLDRDEERRARIAEKTMDAERLNALLDAAAAA